VKDGFGGLLAKAWSVLYSSLFRATSSFRAVSLTQLSVDNYTQYDVKESADGREHVE